MKNVSFIVKVHKDTTNLQETLESLKTTIIVGDEVLIHIDPIDLTDENLKVINEWESITERYNKYTSNVVVYFTKIFTSINTNINNKCTKPIIHIFDINDDKNQIKSLRNEN